MAAEAGGGGGLFGLIRTLFNLFYFLVNTAFRLTMSVGVFGALGIAVWKTGAFGNSCVQENQAVLDLIYWRDVVKSGVVFGVGLVFLVCVASCSIISVVAYGFLTLLAATVSLRVYKMIMKQMGKPDHVECLQPLVELPAVEVPADRVHKHVEHLIEQINGALTTLRSLFSLENYLETAKFAILLWSLTYVGAWFSGMALIILAYLAAWSVPKFYETYQEPIDQNLGIVTTHLKNLQDQLQEKVPFLKPKQA